MASPLEDTWGIAVVGMACRFPGVRDVDEFWEVLRSGRETIRDLTDEELRSGELELDRMLQDPSYVRRRGVLEDVDRFDAGFFGIGPREAAVLDPQQRLWLETAYEALEDAGLAPTTFDGKVGVYAGTYLNNYLLYNLCVDREYIERLVRFRSPEAFFAQISNDKDYIATRTAYKLNLTGPAVSVQTACSTSLVAVCQAVQSLLSHETDACLAGGSCIPSPQEKGYLYQEGGMVSADGRCRPFDADASGTVFSAGVGAVVLKRLQDALEAGDPIRAVIKGVGVNNDGSQKVSFTAPSVEGQAEAISSAMAMANVPPRSITFVETHGTATPLGDPIEVAGLTKAFGDTQDTGFCGLGAVKSNLGHLDAAAGVAGLIKTVLCLENRMLPPTLHYRRANPEIDFGSTPFYVVDRLQPWDPDGPRRAGVSSFGVGGTNAHVVLEESPVREPVEPLEAWQVLPISARSPEALDARVRDLHEAWSRNPDLEPSSVARTLQEGRDAWESRRVVVARDRQGALEAMAGGAPARVVSSVADRVRRRLVFMFPGQGAQHPGMGEELYREEPVFREVVDRCAGLLQPILDTDIRTVLFPGEGDEDEAGKRLERTSLTQPAIFAVELATAELWRSVGLQPSAMIGHSVGEYTAACLSGVMSVEDAIRALAARARLMDAQEPGSMLSVRLPAEELEGLLDHDLLALAAANGPRLSVASGPDEAIAELARRLEERGVDCSRLHTSHAYHSPMMDPALDPFREIVRDIRLSEPGIPFVSTVTGGWITAEEATDPEYWVRQIRSTVRFRDAVLQVASGADALVEVGPGRTLATLARQNVPDPDVPIVPTLPHPSEAVPARAAFLRAAGSLWTRGFQLDWSAFRKGKGRRVRLPTYPWERKSYWIHPPERPNSGRPAVDRASAIASEDSMMSTTAPSPPDPRSVLIDELRSMLEGLSGMPFGADRDGTTFLELGLDSLFLTQVSAALKDRFGVRIGFRQLFEDISTLELLSEEVAREIQPDRLQELMPKPEPVAPPPPPPARESGWTGAPMLPIQAVGDGGASGTGETVVERVIREQMRIMEMQLHALGGAGRPSTVVPELPTPSSGQAAQAPASASAEATGPRVQATLPSSSVEADASTTGRFGPYKKIERARDGGLTESQQQHLDTLIGRFSSRALRSKEIEEAFRVVQADPRSISNFRSVWKELVFQIVASESGGSRIRDVDGNEYIDITMGFGVNLLGHSPEWLREAISAQLEKGMPIGPQAELAGEVAELVSELTGMERVSFCNTGSEAVMAALRMARAVTGRTRVAYFAGDYHGVFDEVLAAPRRMDGKLTTVPIAPGIPDAAVESAMVLRYGDPESLEILRGCADELAAVLVEPVQSRHPDLRPAEFVRSLRELTRTHGAALIFDEVITGFRVHPRGMQEVYGVDADLAAYGKVIGGGLPIGVVAGSRRYMDALDGGEWHFGDDSVPERDVTFFAGTFVRHPLVMAAARAVLLHLRDQGPELQRELNWRTTAFAEELNAFFRSVGVPIGIRQYSSWFRFDFPPQLTFAPLLFFHLVERGVYVREPGQNCFFSTAHTDEEIEAVADAVKESVRELQAAGFFPAATSGEGLPLTGPQQEIRVMSALGPEASCAFNECFQIRFRGDLDEKALLRSVALTGSRHDGLRMRFDDLAQGQTPGPAPGRPETVDLSGLDADAAQDRLEELIREEQRTPFDLVEGPLFRSRLVTLGGEERVLLCTAHHIVFDGWSSTVFIQDVRDCYNALTTRVDLSLEEAESFTAYLQERAAEADVEDLAYWSSVYAKHAPPLSLPLDHERPDRRRPEGGTVKHTFSAEAYEAARNLAKRQGVTLYNAMLAVYAALLQRLSGQDDLVVGIPVAGQSITGRHHLVGHCLNMLPLRVRGRSGDRFSDFLARVRTGLLEARDHQGASLGSIVREVRPPRDPARLALVEVVFNLDRALPDLDFAGVDATVEETGKSYSTFDLFFNLNEMEGATRTLTLNLDYAASLYSEPTVRGWVEVYEAWLLHLGRDPDRMMSELPLPEGTEVVPRA